MNRVTKLCGQNTGQAVVKRARVKTEKEVGPGPKMSQSQTLVFNRMDPRMSPQVVDQI